MPALSVPDLAAPRELALPEYAERTLANGLTVIVVRRASVPLVEIRLTLPFAKADLAASTVLGQTLFAGTDSMSLVEIAAETQRVGGGLGAGTDADYLSVSGNCLASGLPRILEILAEVLTGATYPTEEIITERERLADRITVARTQPSHLAREALLRRIYAGHPYEIGTPEPTQVKAIDSAALQTLHADRVRASGATLVLVGDVEPTEALDTAERALTAWRGDAASVELPRVPDLVPGPISVVPRKGSVQSSLRMALPAVDRHHPDYVAQQLVNLIYGGYFSSRLVHNIREDKGYTYAPHSGVEQSRAGATLVISSDVATEVTAPALVETWYELGRIATMAPEAEELEQARQYALGTLRLGLATQAGQARLVASLASDGLRLPWLAGHIERLEAATLDQITAAASNYLAPAKAVTLVLGDAGEIADSLRAIAPVEIVEEA